MQADANEDNSSEIASLPLAKARRFFAALKQNPFLAIVVEDDKVHIYTKGIDIPEEEMTKIQSALRQITEE